MIRIGAGIIAVLVVLLGLAFWKIDRQAEKITETKAELATANAQVKALDDARKRDNQIAAELATFREQQTLSLRQFDETLKTSKVTREVRYVTQTGETVTCVNRDPAQYRLRFNQALSPSTSP